MTVLRARLAAHITSALSDWPDGEVTAFARLLRRFAEDGLFTP